MHIFTKKQKEFIEENAKGIGNEELKNLFNSHFKLSLSREQIKRYKANHKISSGLTGFFQKGSTPFNKGKKKYWKGGEETQFKKGNKPHNWVPIGSERISKDGYIQIKIQEDKKQHNWRGRHILIWEQHNGPLPRGHAILFGDGNNRNFDINNLILVSRHQLLELNKNNLIQKDADLTKLAIKIADLNIKIYERKK